MALTDTNYADSERNRRGILDINTNDYWFEKLRPYIQEMMRTCKTDGELYRTLEKVTNSVDPLCVNKKYDLIPNELEVLNKAINDANYFNGPMKKAPEEEKNMVRELITKLSDFIMIIKCEEDVVEEAPKIKERIDYSPNGENGAYLNHNMKELNKPINSKRIPNI